MPGIWSSATSATQPKWLCSLPLQPIDHLETAIGNARLGRAKTLLEQTRNECAAHGWQTILRPISRAALPAMRMKHSSGAAGTGDRRTARCTGDPSSRPADAELCTGRYRSHRRWCGPDRRIHGGGGQRRTGPADSWEDLLQHDQHLRRSRGARALLILPGGVCAGASRCGGIWSRCSPFRSERRLFHLPSMAHECWPHRLVAGRERSPRWSPSSAPARALSACRRDRIHRVSPAPLAGPV
jgi:hypothetical protein